MPIEHILRAMQAQADVEIEKTTHAADEEAAQHIAEAENEAQTIRVRHRARVEPLLINDSASLQNKAKLSVLRATAQAREQLITNAFTQAETSISQIRASKEYPAIFRALAREALEELSGDLVVSVDPRDAELATRVFKELGTPADIETQPIPLGGLKVMTRDGRVTIVNTLATRLERAHALLRGPIAGILVEKSK